MGEFGIEYAAVAYYDYKGGERIVFVQQTAPDLAKMVWRDEGRRPVVDTFYGVADYKNPISLSRMKCSIFDDMGVFYMIGNIGGQFGYSVNDTPEYFTQIRLYIEGLPCVVCGNRYGVVFTDVHTQEPLLNKSARIWEEREEKSLYRILKKMLSRIKDVYGVDYAMSNFI